MTGGPLRPAAMKWRRRAVWVAFLFVLVVLFGTFAVLVHSAG